MKLITSISTLELTEYVTSQCNLYFPDNQKIKAADLLNCVKKTLIKIEYCFNFINLPYYNYNNSPFFNHLNGDHYCIFLCYLSRVVFVETNDVDLASKIFLLNKSLFGIDAYYGIELPDIFMVVHPVGTILGRAKYSNRLVVYQGVTVGATIDGVYPVFSENTILYSNSSIIGKCQIGNNFILGANSTLVNVNIENNKTVVGTFPNNKIIEGKNIFTHYFKI